MANALYTRAKEAFLRKEEDFLNDAVKATLIDSGQYTFSAAHTTYATDVAAGSKIAVSAALGSPTVTGGVFDTADFSWSSVSGVQSEAIILWDDTPTTPVADPLVAFYDTGMTGMPVTPSGGNINVTVNASGWFAI
jgi:hypothetical protein